MKSENHLFSPSQEIFFDVKGIKKIFVAIGLIFAQISNFFFCFKEAIPIEGFFIFDLYLIISLFFLIHQQFSMHHLESIFAHYSGLLGSLNNFLATFFFLLWGVFFPEQDLAFVEEVGLNGNLQIVFDVNSLIILSLIFKQYKNKIGGKTFTNIAFSELLLFIILLTTVFLI